jgi:DNA-binding winged helix-turn-helix (wHTH) protein/tetratricopeptide (TPR) repeat protein
MSQTGSRYEFGPFTLDSAEQVLLRDGQRVPLKPKVFDLLRTLVENNGHVVSKDELLNKVWPSVFVGENNLTVSIFALRKALGETRNPHSYIETVSKRGYRFSAEVKESSNSDKYVMTEPGMRRSPLYEKTASEMRDRTVAVLPFKVVGSETGNEYLGIGIADSLITKLTNIRQIRIRPTSAVRKYAGEQELSEVARRLKVDLVLEGTIRRVENRLRISVQLVNPGEGTTLWARKFDDHVASIFEVEDSISDQIIGLLSPELAGEQRRRSAEHSPLRIDAYHAYLKGVYFLNKRNANGFGKAVESFERAIAIDPSYAMAYAGLADAYNLLVSYGVLSPKRAIPKAKVAVLKALELDDSLAQAHTSLARLKVREWNWPDAEKEFRRAVELDPNYSNAHLWYSTFLRVMYRLDEAWREITLARELDPVSPSIEASIGALFYFAGRYDEAIEQLVETIEMDPQFAFTHFLLGMVYAVKRAYAGAIKQYEEARTLWGKSWETSAYLGHIWALRGNRAKALKATERLKLVSAEGHESRYHIALIYTALGEKDEAFGWLETAWQEREESLALLKIDPMLDELREDPRFISLLQRVGLASNDADRLNC